MFLNSYIFMVIIATGLASCQLLFPYNKNKIIVTKPLKDREAKDPVLENHIALINEQGDSLSYVQYKNCFEIILNRINFLVNQRDLEDYECHTPGGLSDTLRLKTEGDKLICEPAYLSMHGERVPKNHRINFTPFHVKAYALFLFRRK